MSKCSVSCHEGFGKGQRQKRYYRHSFRHMAVSRDFIQRKHLYIRHRVIVSIIERLVKETLEIISALFHILPLRRIIYFDMMINGQSTKLNISANFSYILLKAHLLQGQPF